MHHSFEILEFVSLSCSVQTDTGSGISLSLSLSKLSNAVTEIREERKMARVKDVGLHVGAQIFKSKRTCKGAFVKNGFVIGVQ
jgi:hypothetical protein